MLNIGGDMAISKKAKSKVGIIFVLCVLNTTVALAWNDQVTHPGLTKETIKVLNKVDGGNVWFEKYLQNF